MYGHMTCVENTLMMSHDITHAVQALTDRRLQDGYHLVNKVETIREKLLLGANQVNKCTINKL